MTALFIVHVVWGELLDLSWSFSFLLSVKCKQQLLLYMVVVRVKLDNICKATSPMPDIYHSKSVHSHLSSVKLLHIFLLHIYRKIQAELGNISVSSFLVAIFMLLLMSRIINTQDIINTHISPIRLVQIRKAFDITFVGGL